MASKLDTFGLAHHQALHQALESLLVCCRTVASNLRWLDHLPFVPPGGIEHAYGADWLRCVTQS